MHTINGIEIKDVFYVPGKPGIIDVVHPVSKRGGYSGETLEEMRLRYPGAEIADWDTVLQASDDMFRSAPIEITEARFMEMLEVLPPVGWTQRNGCESFKLSERTSGNITAIFARVGNRYFEMSDSIAMPHDKIIEAVNRVAGAA